MCFETPTATVNFMLWSRTYGNYVCVQDLSSAWTRILATQTTFDRITVLVQLQVALRTRCYKCSYRTDCELLVILNYISGQLSSSCRKIVEIFLTTTRWMGVGFYSNTNPTITPPGLRRYSVQYGLFLQVMLVRVEHSQFLVYLSTNACNSVVIKNGENCEIRWISCKRLLQDHR